MREFSDSSDYKRRESDLQDVFPSGLYSEERILKKMARYQISEIDNANWGTIRSTHPLVCCWRKIEEDMRSDGHE
jgi:hypothetical protein